MRGRGWGVHGRLWQCEPSLRQTLRQGAWGLRGKGIVEAMQGTTDTQTAVTPWYFFLCYLHSYQGPKEP